MSGKAMIRPNSPLHHLLAIFTIIVSVFMVDAPARAAEEPLTVVIHCKGAADQCAGHYNVPANQQLVIKYVSFSCNITRNPNWGEFLIDIAAAGVNTNTAVTLPQNAGGKAFAQLGQTVLIYAAGSSQIYVFAILKEGAFSSLSETDDCNAVLTGSMETAS
jgi:hypothetical protein